MFQRNGNGSPLKKKEITIDFCHYSDIIENCDNRHLDSKHEPLTLPLTVSTRLTMTPF